MKRKVAKIDLRWINSKKKIRTFYKARYTRYNDRLYIWKMGDAHGQKPLADYDDSKVEMNIDGKGWGKKKR